MTYAHLPLKPQTDDILWRHLRELPYFRAMVRAVEDSFFQGLELPEPVIDLGSGDGQFAKAAFSRQLCVGLDPWWAPLRESRDLEAYRLLVQADGARSPFRDGEFASAVSNSVLEHIPHVDQVAAEVNRILKPGGLFVFCVPNQRFPRRLLGVEALEKIGVKGLADRYSVFFNRISRHQHCDSFETWNNRLEKFGFTVERHWDYFPPAALHRLEVGHALGLPALFWKKVTGKWVLVQAKANLWPVYRLCAPVFHDPLSSEGVYSFYIARKVAGARA